MVEGRHTADNQPRTLKFLFTSVVVGVLWQFPMRCAIELDDQARELINQVGNPEEVFIKIEDRQVHPQLFDIGVQLGKESCSRLPRAG